MLVATSVMPSPAPGTKFTESYSITHEVAVPISVQWNEAEVGDIESSTNAEVRGQVLTEMVMSSMAAGGLLKTLSSFNQRKTSL